MQATTRAAVETFAACREAAKREVGAQDMEMAFALGIAREYRKAFAVQAMKHPTISGLLFTLLDGGDIRSPVWQMIRPEAETPFQPRDTTG